MRAAPRQEHEEAPDPRPINSSAAFAKSSPEPCDGFSVEPYALCEREVVQGVVQPRPEALPAPGLEGENEARLWTIEEPRIEVGAHELTQERLPAKRPVPSVFRHTCQRFDHEMVEERNTHLERDRHRGRVGVAEQSLTDEARE